MATESFDLYLFQRGASVWRYTSAAVDLFWHDGEYPAAAIKRGEIGQGPEASLNSLTLDVPLDLPLLDEFRRIPDAEVMTLTLMRSGAVLWTGRVLGVAFAPDHARITCEPVTVSLKRTGLRRLYSKTCAHVLYGSDCRVVATPLALPLLAQDGVLLTLPAASLVDQAYAGGWVENLAGTQRVMLIANTPQTASLLYPASFQPGESLLFYRGCDHTLATCQARFGNVANYGGFPWIPAKNPFDTGVF